MIVLQSYNVDSVEHHDMYGSKPAWIYCLSPDSVIILSVANCPHRHDRFMLLVHRQWLYDPGGRALTVQGWNLHLLRRNLFSICVSPWLVFGWNAPVYHCIHEHMMSHAKKTANDGLRMLSCCTVEVCLELRSGRAFSLQQPRVRLQKRPVIYE